MELEVHKLFLFSFSDGLLQEILSKAMSDYDLIDEFYYSLSDEEFKEKWVYDTIADARIDLWC